MASVEQRLRAQYRRDMYRARLLGDDAFAEEIHAEYSSDPDNAEDADARATLIWLDAAGKLLPDKPTKP